MTAGWSGGTFTRGNGTYEGSSVWADDKAASVKIVASRHDTHDQGLADGINATLNKAGQNSPSTNLSWVHTTHFLGTAGGSSSAYTATPSPTVSAYVTGQMFSLIANHANTGATTLNISSLGAKSIKKFGIKATLSPDDIPNAHPMAVIYDGTDFILLNPAFPGALLRGSGVTDYGASSTSEVTALTLTIPAAAMSTYRKLRISTFNEILNNTGSPVNLTTKLKFGGTQLISSGAVSISSSASRRYFSAFADIQNTGATNTQQFLAWFRGDNTSTFGSASDAVGVTAIDTTASSDFILTVQFGTSSASLGVRTRGWLVEVV
jgi:hypothetical protein